MSRIKTKHAKFSYFGGDILSQELENIAIGQRIKNIRLSLGETTEEFSKHFDPPASKGTISKWENGKYLPNNQRKKVISELGKITVNELLYGSEKEYVFSIVPTNDIDELDEFYKLYKAIFGTNSFQNKETVQDFYQEMFQILDLDQEVDKKLTFAYMYNSYIWANHLKYNVLNENLSNETKEILNAVLTELKNGIQSYNNGFGLTDVDFLTKEDFDNAKDRINYVIKNNEHLSNIDTSSYFSDEYINRLLKETDTEE